MGSRPLPREPCTGRGIGGHVPWPPRVAVEGEWCRLADKAKGRDPGLRLGARRLRSSLHSLGDGPRWGSLGGALSRGIWGGCLMRSFSDLRVVTVTQANVLPALDPARPRRLPGQCGSAGVPGPWVLPDSGNGRSAPGLPGPHPGIRAGPSSFGPSELQGLFPYAFGAGVH